MSSFNNLPVVATGTSNNNKGKTGEVTLGYPYMKETVSLNGNYIN